MMDVANDRFSNLTNFNISIRKAEQYFFLLNSFVSSKTTSNEPGFIEIGREGTKLITFTTNGKA